MRRFLLAFLFGMGAASGAAQESVERALAKKCDSEIPWITDGTELTVYVQNLGAAGSLPAPGQRVRLEWLPEHTFVVEPSAPLSTEEEVE